MTDQITTAEALDALPDMSGVLDGYGYLWQVHGWPGLGRLWSCGSPAVVREPSQVADRLLERGPLTVVFRPDAPPAAPAWVHVGRGWVEPHPAEPDLAREYRQRGTDQREAPCLGCAADGQGEVVVLPGSARPPAAQMADDEREALYSLIDGVRRGWSRMGSGTSVGMADDILAAGFHRTHASPATVEAAARVVWENARAGTISHGESANIAQALADAGLLAAHEGEVSGR